MSPGREQPGRGSHLPLIRPVITAAPASDAVSASAPPVALADYCSYLLLAPLPFVVQVVDHQVRYPMEGGEVSDLLQFPVAELVLTADG